MAPITKKTYSKRNNELYGTSNKEKENIDPFDELLSSPLKQEVEFKPLSFWSKDLKNTKSQKNNSNRCGLYDSSDPDDSYSPYKKKKQRKCKSAVGKIRRLQVRSNSHMNLRSESNNSNSNNLTTSSTLESFINTPVCSNIDKSSSTFDNERGFEFVTLRRHFTKAKCSESIFRNSSVNKGIASSTFDSQNCCLGQPKSLTSCREISTVCSAEFKELEKQKVKQVVPLCGIKNESSDFNASKSSFKLSKVQKGNQSSPNVNFYRNKGNITVEVTPYCDNTFALGEDTLILQKENRYSDNVEVKNRRKFSSYIQENWEMLNETSTPSVSDTTLKNVSECFMPNSSSEESSTFQNETNLTVIKGGRRGKEETEGTESDSFHLKNVTSLTTMISDMTISKENKVSFNKLDETINNSSTIEGAQNSEKLTSHVFRNVTTRRRFNNSGQLKPYSLRNPKIRRTSSKNENKETLEVRKMDEIDIKLGNSPTNFANECKNNLSLVSDRYSCFTVPTFESTRIENVDYEGAAKCDMKFDESQESTFIKGMNSCQDTSVVLKDGKKWWRSISVLKQVQSGKIVANDLESTKVKGRRFKSFVQEILDMQNAGISPIKRATSEANCNVTLMNTPEKNKDSGKSCRLNSAVNLQREKDEDENSLTKHDSSYTGSPNSPSIFNKTSLNHTVKVVKSRSSLGAQSAFRSALNLDSDDSLSESSVTEELTLKEKSLVITPKDFILKQCGQEDVLPFEKYFNKRTLKDCRKIGEGVYGEVFMCNSDRVIKIIPIEGSDLVNGEPQKKFEEILSEVVIASKLSNLRKGHNHRTSGFSELKRCWCVEGKYPRYLLDLWEEYDQSGTGSENDSPKMFKSDQLYIILELANGGKDLEAYVFNSSEQSLAIFIQAAFSLAAAEKAFEFEHRDLHWGNLLIAPTDEKFMIVILDNVEYKIPTKGVKVSIIDFTLSRILHDGCCIFNDLSVDPELFISQGDYQFEIYRLMQKVLENDWSMFAPKTNLYWLHYTLDKMIKMVRYKNIKTQLHKKSMKMLKTMENVILDYKDSTEFVLTHLVKYVDCIPSK